MKINLTLLHFSDLLDLYLYNVLCVSLRPGTKACWWPSSSSICRMTVKWWGWTSDGYWPSLASRWRQWVWWTSLTSNGRLSWREWLFVCCCFFPLHSISGTLTLTFFPACLEVCRSFTSCLCRWWSWYVLYTPNFVCAFIETLCLCLSVPVCVGACVFRLPVPVHHGMIDYRMLLKKLMTLTDNFVSRTLDATIKSWVPVWLLGCCMIRATFCWGGCKGIYFVVVDTESL